MRVVARSGAGGGVGRRRPLHQPAGPVQFGEGGRRYGVLVAGVELLLEGGEVPGVCLGLAAAGPGQVESGWHLRHPGDPGEACQALGEHLPVGGAHALEDVSVLVTEAGHHLPLAGCSSWREAGEANALADGLLEQVPGPDVGLGAQRGR